MVISYIERFAAASEEHICRTTASQPHAVDASCTRQPPTTNSQAPTIARVDPIPLTPYFKLILPDCLVLLTRPGGFGGLSSALSRSSSSSFPKLPAFPSAIGDASLAAAPPTAKAAQPAIPLGASRGLAILDPPSQTTYLTLSHPPVHLPLYNQVAAKPPGTNGDRTRQHGKPFK